MRINQIAVGNVNEKRRRGVRGEKTSDQKIKKKHAGVGDQNIRGPISQNMFDLLPI